MTRTVTTERGTSVDPDVGEPFPGTAAGPQLRQHADDLERVRLLYWVTALRTTVIWDPSVVVAGQEPATV
ncbi:hypothetical protein [Streptomyces sp. NPDC092903]|uniref:hypothetical protein n=1 Tax=Streptomyces sp. NPDC092903 TaxID=3366017 RepID=UPI00380E88F9